MRLLGLHPVQDGAPAAGGRRGGRPRAAGVDGTRLDWAQAREYRDYMARHLDDSGQVRSYTDQGALVLKGAARLVAPRRLSVAGRELSADHVIVATGSAGRSPGSGGRIVADAILGRPRTASYDGIPRVAFADPEIAAAGLTRAQADQQGLHTVAAEIDLAESIARPWTYERDPRGHLGLLADTDRRVLVGAGAVAPQAGEWIHQAALAIRTGIPIDVLLDQVAQFPTYSEGYLKALEALDM